MKQILKLFPTVMMETILPEINNQNLVEDIEKMFEGLTVHRLLSHQWNYNVENSAASELGYSSFNDPNGDLIKNPIFKEFFDHIAITIDDFFHQLEYTGKWNYVNSWASIYPKNSWVPGHSHGDAHWAGVYYVKVPLDSNSPIIFHDPKEYALSAEPTGFKYRGDNGEIIASCEGKLLLWPGYLKHYTMPNMSDESRIIISFNIKCG